MSRKRFYPSTPKGKQENEVGRTFRPTTSVQELSGEPKEAAVFTLLMERLDQMQREQHLTAQILANLQTEQDAQRRALQAEMVAAKRESMEAISAVMRVIEGKLNQQQVEPQQKEALEQQARQEAVLLAERKRANFMETLRQSPKGNIYNPFEEAVPLMINGVMCLVRSGQNENIPGPFMELWAEWIQRNRDAKNRQKLIQGVQKFADVERWLGSGNEQHMQRINHWG